MLWVMSILNMDYGKIGSEDKHTDVMNSRFKK